MTLRGIAALAAVGLLAACSRSEPPGQVALSLHDAYARLADNPLAAFMEERQCGVLIHIKAEGRQDQSVTWRIASSGKEMLNFTVALTPVDAGHTKFDVVIPRDHSGFEAYGEELAYRRPAIMQPTRPAIEEQVAALLQGRPYDASKLPSQNENGCRIQRGAIESGGKPFSVNDLKMPNAYVIERFKNKQAVK